MMLVYKVAMQIIYCSFTVVQVSLRLQTILHRVYVFKAIQGNKFLCNDNSIVPAIPINPTSMHMSMRLAGVYNDPLDSALILALAS